jgi:hypothetical protein
VKDKVILGSLTGTCKLWWSGPGRQRKLATVHSRDPLSSNPHPMNSPVISISQRPPPNPTDILVNASANSSSSIFFAEGEVEVVTEQGLRHAELKLEAR